MDIHSPISTCAIYIYTTAIYPKSNVEYATIPIWDAILLRLGGTPNICIQHVGTSSTRPIEHHSIRSLGTSPTRLPDHSAAKVDQSDRGAYTVTPQCHLGFLLKCQTKNHHFM
jgi:hypothetical protein